MKIRKILSVVLISLIISGSINAQKISLNDIKFNNSKQSYSDVEEHTRMIEERFGSILISEKQIKSINGKHKADEQDSLALVALYNATGGDNWTNNDNWLTGNVSNWYGIFLDGDGRVDAISLNNNELNGIIPFEIGNLSSLIELQLSNNSLNGNIPPEIGNLANLQKLSISKNELSGNIPSELGNLNNLQDFYLHMNQLSGSIPPELGNLSELISLFLYKNNIDGNIPPELGNLSNLQLLILFENNLTGNIPPEIGNLNSLYYFDVWINQLSGGIPPEFANLTNLFEFWLSGGNKFTDLPNLSSLTELNRCYIDNNNFDFQDMNTAAITVSDLYEYSPQAPIRVVRTENAGQITFEYIGLGPNNLYQWYNGDNELIGETSNILIINDTNDGAYYCLINDPNFPALTLQSVTEEVGNSGTNHGIISEEYDALIDFYYSTGGENWKREDYWLSDTTVQVWLGLQVSGIHLKAIDLYRNLLVGSMNDIIDVLIQFDYLNFLRIGDNQLTGTLAPEIGNLSNLQIIDLGNNQLSGNIPSEIGDLNNLKILYLDNNQFSNGIPSEIGNLSNLEILYLHINQLTGAVPTSMLNLNNLKRVYLNNNEIVDLPDLSSLTNLSSLFVNKNFLTFEDIEPNISASFYFDYSPQGKVGSIESHQVDIGGSLTLSVDVGGDYNTYQWYKDDIEISGAAETTYEITNFSLDDAGVYVCKISNTVATLLELVSHDKFVSNETFYSLTFVIDDGDDPIEDAEISIHDQLLTTDEFGEAVIDLNNGSYDYSVTALDFEPASGNVIISDAPYTEYISLVSTNITNIISDNINIYPNPANDYFILESSCDQNFIISIFNINGSKLITKQISESENRIYIGELPKGLFLIKIQQGNKVIVKKLLVQ